MRAWSVVLFGVAASVVAASSVAAYALVRAYDPIAEVPHRHREFATTGDAIAAILAENPSPRVYAIGEYHQTRDAIAATSPLARFTQQVAGKHSFPGRELSPTAQGLPLEISPRPGAPDARQQRQGLPPR